MRLMIFDSHVHVGAWVTPDFAGHSTTLVETAATLLAAGIGGALVMPSDSGDNDALLAELDAWSGPVRFVAAAWAMPDQAGFATLLAPGRFGAVKIHPSFCRRPVTDPCWRPAIQAARDMKLPVVVHCGRWQQMAGWGLLMEVAARWPDVDFVMAHMGGDSPALVTAASDAIADSGFRNVYMGTESIREYWLISRAVRTVGADRILFGSDHNLNAPASFLAVIDAAGLSCEERDAVLGGNARRLFGV